MSNFIHGCEASSYNTDALGKLNYRRVSISMKSSTETSSKKVWYSRLERTKKYLRISVVDRSSQGSSHSYFSVRCYEVCCTSSHILATCSCGGSSDTSSTVNMVKVDLHLSKLKTFFHRERHLSDSFETIATYRRVLLLHG